MHYYIYSKLYANRIMCIAEIGTYTHDQSAEESVTVIGSTNRNRTNNGVYAVQSLEHGGRMHK